MALKLSNKHSAQLWDYLSAHEHEIAIGENDFGSLAELFRKALGRPPLPLTP